MTTVYGRLCLSVGCFAVGVLAGFVVSNAGRDESDICPPAAKDASVVKDALESPAEARQRKGLELARQIADWLETNSDPPETLLDSLSLLGVDSLPGVEFLLVKGGSGIPAGLSVLDAVESGAKWSVLDHGDGERIYASRPVPGAEKLVARFLKSDVELMRSDMMRRVPLYFDKPEPLLLEMTHDRDRYVRTGALELLGNLPRASESAEDRIIEGFEDADPMVRAQAAAAAGKQRCLRSLPGLRALLDDQAAVERVYGKLSCFDTICGRGEAESIRVRDVAVWAVQKIERRFYGFVSRFETMEDMDVIVARIKAGNPLLK